MTTGFPYFQILASGSTATSANTAHSVFGSYGGLSLLNQNDVVHVQLNIITADARVGGNNALTNNTGLRLTTAASLFDLPPMRAAGASQLHITPDAGGGNPTVQWVVWSRWGGDNK